jgi:hypothetical protein
LAASKTFPSRGGLESIFPSSVGAHSHRQLVNNAGFGLRGEFRHLSLPRRLEMLRLSKEAIVEPTYSLPPGMFSQVGCKVIEATTRHGREPPESVSMILYRLNLYPYRRILNQTLMFANAFHLGLSNSSISRSLFLRQGLCMARNACAAIALALLFWTNTAFAQFSAEDSPRPIVALKQVPIGEPVSSPQQEPDPNTQPQSSSVPTALAASPPETNDEAKQSKRILWIFPNYRAVSANTQLPPLSLKNKFWLATQDSFDYSSFVTAGILAGVGQAKKSYPEFGQGAKGYGRYYWHTMADQAVGNYLTEAIVPAVTHEDPRYYTLGHGGFFKRTGYAVSRLLVTRTDWGGRTINISEIVGNGAGAGISDLYYPSRERTWTKTGQKWLTQIALDGAFNIVKEFWPDINHAIFHGKY